MVMAFALITAGRSLILKSKSCTMTRHRSVTNGQKEHIAISRASHDDARGKKIKMARRRVYEIPRLSLYYRDIFDEGEIVGHRCRVCPVL